VIPALATLAYLSLGAALGLLLFNTKEPTSVLLVALAWPVVLPLVVGFLLGLAANAWLRRNL